MLLVAPAPIQPVPAADDGCKWWDLPCQGGTQVMDSGLSAITRATANGANQLLSEIVKVVDESTQVPLTDPTYRDVYSGFLGLATPLIGIVLCAAVMVAALRRDAGTLGRTVSGLVVATLGGAFYIVFAQLLVALDNWLSHGIVRVTGHGLTDGLTETANGFARIGGQPTEVAANMLMIVLMMVMLLAGVILWFVLVLRKIAILVVVAFAPLLIAGYLWAPTRSWVVRATEVLVALVFTKTAIYALFGIGLALLSRGGEQTLSDFVGEVVLLCGACFTPLLMLRLVHFAGQTQVAGEMMGTLRGGVQPVLNHMPMPGTSSPGGRHDLARQAGQAPVPDMPQPSRAVPIAGSSGTTAGAGSGGASSAGGAASGGAAAGAAAGPAGIALAAGAVAASAATGIKDHVSSSATDLASAVRRNDERPMAGPPAQPTDATSSEQKGES